MMSDSVRVLSYKNAIDTSIKSIRYVFIIIGLINYLYASRTTVCIEYAKTFEDYSLITNSWILCVDSLLNGLVGICFSSLGYYIGYGRPFFFKLLLISTGCILEAFADDFTILCI